MSKKQPEALRLAKMLTADEWPGSVTLVSYARECVAELLRLHAENETLRASHGQAPAGAGEPFCWHWENTFNGGMGAMKKNPETLGINMSHPDYKWTALYTAPPPSPTAQAAESVLEDAARYRWLFGARTEAQSACVSETVFKPLPQDEVLSHLQGFYMSKPVVDALVDAARKQGAKHDNH